MWNHSSAFVEKVCEGRDPSHGHKHMKSVAINALFIYENTKNELKSDHVSDLVITVGFLHDVNDYKYDPEKKLVPLMHKFLAKHYNEKDIQLIMNIIDRISYSKENKAIQQNQKLDWQEVLGETGCFVRDIVSDADKLEAIGKVGIERCMEYTQHSYREKYNKEITTQELVVEVIKHSHEKLLRLKDEFIRTPVGKRMAEPLHEEMITELANYLSQYSWKENS